MADSYTPRMRKLYDETIAKAMTEKFGYKNVMEVPRLDKIDKVRGMDIIVTTTAKTDDEARELLRLFGVPFPQEATEEKQAA